MTVTKQDCDKNVKTMSDKIDNLKDKMNSFEKTVIREISKLPIELEKRFDDRYAQKHTELDVHNIQGNINKLVWVVIGSVVVGVLNLVIK